MKVLIAEDDPITRQGLIDILEGEGFQVIAVDNGADAITQYTSLQPDFLCLDVMMPEVNGYDVCKRIRREAPDVPIIFITAKGEEIDKVVGLELGADDYIVKPFGVKEVIARIRAVARRSLRSQQQSQAENCEFWLTDLRVSPNELRAYRGDSKIDLSLREVKILKVLFDCSGQVVDRNKLMDAAWSQNYFPNSRTLDQHISQLRKRIEIDPKSPTIIQTVHGVGYRFQDGSAD